MKTSRYTVGDRPVRCPHCSGEDFSIGEAQLNSKGMEFFNLGWANASAATLACGECGNIQWFTKKPEATT